MWLGATSLGQDPTWRWAGTHQPLTYTNWRPGQPEVRRDAWQACAYMRTQGEDWRWDDWRCETVSLNYVCEITLDAHRD